MLSVGGTAILLVSIWQFFAKNSIEAFKSSLLIFAVVTAHVQIGYFMRIGDLSITIPDTLLVLNGAIAGMLIFSRSGRLTISIAEIFFLFSIFLGIIALIAIPHSEPLVPLGVSWTAVISGTEAGKAPSFGSAALIYILRIVLFLAILRLLILEHDRIRLPEFIEKFSIYSAPFIFIYFAEFLIKLFFETNIVLDLGNMFFGQAGAQLDFLLERGGLLALQGLSLEPNFLTQSILIFSLAYLSGSPKQLWVRISFALVYPLLIFSGSLQAFLVAVTIPPFLLIYRKTARSLIVAFFFSVALLILGTSQAASGLSEYFLSRLLLLMQALTDYEGVKYQLIQNSEVVRFVSIVENFKLSTFNGFLGVGLGSTYAYGFVPSALSNIGIVGFLTWLWVMHRFFKSAGYRVIAWRAALMALLFIFVGNLHLLYYPSILIFGFALAMPVKKRTITSDVLAKDSKLDLAR